MSIKIWLGVAFVAVAVVSFYAGGTFILQGGSLTSLPSASGVDYAVVLGSVVSIDETSLTIRLEDGSNKTVSFGPDTRAIVLQAPVPAKAEDMVAGAAVSVALRDGVAEVIQIFKTQDFAALPQ